MGNMVNSILPRNDFNFGGSSTDRYCFMSMPSRMAMTLGSPKLPGASAALPMPNFSAYEMSM